ncbi:MAG: ABC transporter permease [Ktedonobacteraceae bacterium]|nr:ABC transporter permease [Ktedonobacteraceae bacterium]
MGIVIRGMRNVVRNPLRLLLIVLLLGASLMFVAAMVSLNSSAQQQLAKVRSEVGTGITISYVTENQNQTQTNGNNNNNNNGGFPGGGGNGNNNNNGGFDPFRSQNESTPIPSDAINKVKGIAGVTSVEGSLRRFDTDGVLKTASVTTPDGKTRTIPASIYGISSDSTHFSIQGGTPTITAGRGFQTGDAQANVALMSKTLADANKLKVGSTFTLKGAKITIIGLYTSDAATADNTLTLPLATMQKLYDVSGVDSITAYATTYDQVDTVAAKIRTLLGSKYNVVTENRLYSNAISALSTAQNSITLALIVAIATSAAIIIFSVFVIVRERTTEIGTLKAIGASHWQVITQFWTEVLALSVLASAVATVLLVTLGPIISQKFDVSTAATDIGTRGGPGGAFITGGNAAAQSTPVASGTPSFRGGFGGFGQIITQRLGDIHLSTVTLNAQTLLIIMGLGIGLAILTSIIPALYVARIRPAVVLRRGNN